MIQTVHCSGYLKRRKCEGYDDDVIGLLAIGYTLPSTAATEIRLSAYTFMFRTTTDLKIVFLDTR